MSLDCVEMSLGRVFASGQAYVALSRARSLQGLRVLDFDPMVVRCDSRVLRFYASLRQGRGLGPVRESHPMVGHVAVGSLRARMEERPRDPGRGWQSLPWLHWGQGQKEEDVGPQAVVLGYSRSPLLGFSGFDLGVSK